jgi:hypothetical protein
MTKYVDNLERIVMKHESEGEVNLHDTGNERDRNMKRIKNYEVIIYKVLQCAIS